MKVYKIEPHSYCEGVVKAFLLAKKAHQEGPSKPVYLLGSLVHNESAIQSLLQENFVLLDEREKPLKESLMSVPAGSTLLFSAHGHPSSFDKLAETKHLKCYDATCPFVKKNQEMAESFLANGHEIIYLGEKGHQECEAFLSISPHVYLLDSAHLDSFDWGQIQDKAPIFLSQTTMSNDEVREATGRVYAHCPTAYCLDSRCESTKKRQNEVALAPRFVDLFIILGSKHSNNTMKLVKIAKETHPDSRIICALNLGEVQKFDLHKNHYCALASGASTSPQDFEAVYQYLLKL